VAYGPTCDPRWLSPYMVGHYRLEIANNIFNGMRYIPTCRPARKHSVCSMVLYFRVDWHCSGVLRWSTGPTLHCSRMYTCFACIKCVDCLHVLQINDVSDTLKTCVHALEIREPSYIDKPTRLFFILETRGLQGTIGYITMSELSR
jgi:hypothetical protein